MLSDWIGSTIFSSFIPATLVPVSARNSRSPPSAKSTRFLSRQRNCRRLPVTDACYACRRSMPEEERWWKPRTIIATPNLRFHDDQFLGTNESDLGRSDRKICRRSGRPFGDGGGTAR